MKVRITRVATGESRIADFPGEEWSDYQWTDGNYGCDCNRELFFCEAGGETVDLGAVTCSEGRYRAELVEP